MSAPKKRGCLGRSITTVIILLIIAAVVCVGIIAIAAPAIGNLVNTLAAPISASQDFMNDVIAKDYTKAYAMIHPSAQQDFGGSPDGMEQALSDLGIVPTSFKATNVEISGDATVDGTGTFDGKTRYVYITLSKDGDTWKIFNIKVSDDAPTPTPTGG